MKRPLILVLLVLSLALVFGTGGVAMAEPVPLPYLNGTAQPIADGVELTHNVVGDNGSAWSQQYSELGDFAVEFDYAVVDTRGESFMHGDGFCFVVQTAGSNALGSGGGLFGYQTDPEAPQPPDTVALGTATHSSFAFAFDSGDSQLRWGVDGIVEPGIMAVMGSDLGYGSHHVRLDRTGGVITVYIDGAANGYTYDVGEAPYTNAYIGFTGASGTNVQTTQITHVALPPVQQSGSVTVSATVQEVPMLTFGISTWQAPVGGSISASAINFGALTPGVAKTAGHYLDVSTNSATGYTVMAGESRPLTSGANVIPDVLGDDGTITERATGPWSLASTFGFGFALTGTDSAIGPGYRQFADSSAVESPQTIMSNAGAVGSSRGELTYKLNVSPLQPAGTYTNAITYICIANF